LRERRPSRRHGLREGAPSLLVPRPRQPEGALGSPPCGESAGTRAERTERGAKGSSGLDWERLSSLNAEAFDGALALFREQGRSARSCNFKREAAIAFANWSVRSGRIEANALKAVARPRSSSGSPPRPEALSDEELGRLLELAGKRGRRAWYLVAALAGLRRSEVAGLAWGDVNFDEGTIRIARGKAKRTDVVPLHPDLAEELRRIRPSTVLPSARVFATEVTALTVRKDFLRAGIPLVDEAGSVVDLHALRTTLGTRLARAGVAPQIAQRIMRHSDYRSP
jgi:integrase